MSSIVVSFPISGFRFNVSLESKTKKTNKLKQPKSATSLNDDITLALSGRVSSLKKVSILKNILLKLDNFCFKSFPSTPFNIETTPEDYLKNSLFASKTGTPVFYLISKEILSSPLPAGWHFFIDSRSCLYFVNENLNLISLHHPDHDLLVRVAEFTELISQAETQLRFLVYNSAIDKINFHSSLGLKTLKFDIWQSFSFLDKKGFIKIEEAKVKEFSNSKNPILILKRQEEILRQKALLISLLRSVVSRIGMLSEIKPEEEDDPILIHRRMPSERRKTEYTTPVVLPVEKPEQTFNEPPWRNTIKFNDVVEAVFANNQDKIQLRERFVRRMDSALGVYHWLAHAFDIEALGKSVIDRRLQLKVLSVKLGVSFDLVDGIYDCYLRGNSEDDAPLLKKKDWKKTLQITCEYLGRFVAVEIEFSSAVMEFYWEDIDLNKDDAIDFEEYLVWVKKKILSKATFDLTEGPFKNKKIEVPAVSNLINSIANKRN